MAAESNITHAYIGLAGEGEHISSGGIFRRSGDDGEWRSIERGLPPDPQVRALLVDPANPSVVYAGTQLGPYRSDDRGEHWEALEAPRPGMDVWSLAFHPQDSRTIFAGYEPCSIYCSRDAGSTWQQMGASDVTFPDITTYMPPLAKRVIGIASDPSNLDHMYAAIEVGGLLASRDGGVTWEQVIDGPYLRNNTLDLHGVQVSAAAPGTVYIATQVAVFRSPDQGGRWQHVRIEEMFAGGSYCRHMLVAPDDPQTIYLAASAGGGGSPAGTAEAGALFRSNDIGETWERLDIGDTPPSRMSQIAIDKGRPQHVYCCAQAGQVYSSSDHGASWSKSCLPVECSRSRHIYAMACG